MKHVDAWTESQRIVVPELQFKTLTDTQHAVPLRGHAHVLAVFEGNVCVGWILKKVTR